MNKPDNWDTLSGCDHEDEYDERFDMIESRTRPALGLFEKNPYFDRIFPGLRIQKPGYDLYGSTTLMLFLLVVYVFVAFKNFTVDPEIFAFYKG